MKRVISYLLVLCIMGSLFLGNTPGAAAEGIRKEQIPRSIAVVFDNSGSMYEENGKAWCRATYAVEAFAAMMNEGDKLLVYPMHEAYIDDAVYSKDKPIQINGAGQASLIRKIYTPEALATPIETIDAAYNGLKSADGEKWLVVLTDGDYFYENNRKLSGNTTAKLNERLGKYGQELNVLYLGVGAQAAMPSCEENGNYRFVADKATSSTEVLSKLTTMCNLIFGRDSLPANHFSGEKIDFDVSISKLIAFVQGDNVSGVSITDSNGKAVGTKVSENKTKYAEKGSGNYGGGVDKSLQGMVVTYADCPAGSYTLNYSGKASSVEVYYEPDVDLVFTFTESNGKPVNPEALYEGSYSVSFGMKDGKTGEFTNSDLLGSMTYKGHYYINGEEFPIECAEKSGSCSVPLKMDDTFTADMTVRYLSGYMIHKDGKDFGWPGMGLSVASRPAGDLELVISGGDDIYQLATLEQGEHFTAKICYDGQPLTGDALAGTELVWNPELSGAEVKKVLQGDHYELVLSHKDPANPTATPVGEFRFPVTATYAPPGSKPVESAPEDMAYAIEDREKELDVKLHASQSYYQISKLGEGDPIRADLSLDREPLTPEQLEALEFTVNSGGISFTTETLPNESAVLIHLEDTPGISEGKYEISCETASADEIGRVVTDRDEVQIKLGAMALWLKWLILIILLLLLLLLLWLILHIKRMPKYLHIPKKGSVITFDGETMTTNAGVSGEINGSTLKVTSTIAGNRGGVMMNVRPGRESYLMTPQSRRSAEADGASLRKHGSITVQELSIGTSKYVLNEETNKLERALKNSRPEFEIKQGTPISYSGVIQSAGVQKEFSVRGRFDLKKK